ncbi:MAG: hypothetical protein QXO35_03150 [Candidatus Micrarchaeia archaeon]
MDNESKKIERKPDYLQDKIERFDRLETNPLVENSIKSQQHSVIVIIDPNPADDNFYESFFPGNKFIKLISHNDGVRYASKAMEDRTLSAIIVDDAIENGMAPLLVSLFKALSKKTNSEINIFLTYRGNINIRKYSVKPDVILNKDNGNFEIFY